MKYAKLTRLSQRDLRELRGSLKNSIDETLGNYFPEEHDEVTREQRESLNRMERLLHKIDAAELLLIHLGA